MTTAPTGRGALVIAAHGSRREPQANALVRRLAESVRARRLFDQVAVAFHQGEPRFDTVLDELSADAATVVPLFTSAGYYTEVVLPEALARNQRFNELRLRQTPAVGTHSGIPALVARRVSELLSELQISRSSTSLAIVGHGTPKHRESRTATVALAETLRRRRVAGEVLAAFLDDDPPLESLLETASLPHVLVVPFLIGGTHSAADIPRLLATGDRRLATTRPIRACPERSEGAGLLPAHEGRAHIVDRPLGDYPGLVEIIIDLARRHPPPPPRFRGRRATLGKAQGSVSLVGAGPGDPGLITVRGLDLLRQADVVLHDRLIGWGLLGEARAGALLIDAGKGSGHAPYTQQAINHLLVEHARQGRTVVRLKGGDPFVFARGSEEVQACRAAGIAVEVVPGISSAIAGPAAAGIPLTARGIARSFTVMTGQIAEETADISAFSALSALSADTLVILMGRSSLREMTARLLAEGRDPATPAACIQSATTPEQRVTRATLATIADAADRDGLEAPVVVVIGEVASISGAAGQTGSAGSAGRRAARQS